MAMLLGLVRPTRRDGTVLGSSIDEPAAYLPRVGALIESPAFYPALTGAENLRVFATVGGHDHGDDPGAARRTSASTVAATTATAATRSA